MSSVSSFEGSDRDSFFQRSFQDSQASRHSYLRKTDFLDTLDTTRFRDTDAWSVAATIDDQESVISTHGGPPSIISSSRMTLDRETDDDRSTLDGEASIRDHLHEDDEDKRSRSNAAEFGDDGTRSAIGDFDHDVVSDDEDRVHNVVDDQISAPPQPQPSFATVTKSYAELMEENELLQSQLRAAQLAQKHQTELISSLRNMQPGNDLYPDRKEIVLDNTMVNGETNGNNTATNTMTSDISMRISNSIPSNDRMFYDSSSMGHVEIPPIVSARTLTQKLATLAESLTRFCQCTVDEPWRLTLEQTLFLHITESYLTSLPFGTQNQHLLNTAYLDQIRRFQSTLGTNFAKWYRRQTVQSLSLNPATKEYLQDMHRHLTDEMLLLLSNMQKEQDRSLEYMNMWNGILDLCAELSLEIHGGDADVTVQTLVEGSNYDEDVMAVVGDMSRDEGKRVKMMISPLFIDEEEVIILPARVVI
ncbi:hypothetical protein BDB01DRAFT_773501, partial [Pilobolus umbonatus]